MTEDTSRSLKDTPSPFKKIISPYRQAVWFIAALPVMLLLFMIPSWLGFFEVDEYFPWTVAAAFTLLFGLATSVLSLGAENRNIYWGQSITSYMAVMLIGGMFAWALSGKTIYEVPSFRQIYIVFTFGYLALLCILRAMRKVVQIAQEQDAALRGEQ